MLEGVGQKPDVFVNPLKSPSHMEGIQARPHVVALWVGSHEPVQPLQPVAHQLRLAHSSAIIAIRSFAALNSASSRSTFTSRVATEHCTLLSALIVV
jgi:hypothetical protein